MKKYVIGIIATMALFTISCSDDHSPEQLIEEPSRTPMTFVVDKETLTRLDNFDYINEASQLWSFTVVAQVDGKIFQQGNFIYNQVINGFVPENGEIWLWPGDDTKEVTFYATNDQGWGKTQGINNSEPIVGDEYTFNNELGFHDLICAYKKAKRTDCQDGVVHLNFNHALAELGILVRGEFPAGEALNYRIYSIDVQGEYDQNYNFMSKTWRKKTDGDKINYSYFAEDNGFGLFDTNGSYVELLFSQRQQDGDTFRFLQPGTYDISIHYLQGNDEKFRTTTVKLEQGKKNRILLTLPYEPPA